jgi:hypothetical protein
MIRNLNKREMPAEIVSAGEFLREGTWLWDRLMDRGCWWPRSSTCVVKGTEILMADGSIKKIEEVGSGERVLNVKGQPVVVLGTILGIEEIPTRYIKFENGREVRCTEDHTFMMGETMAFLHAKELEVGMKVCTFLKAAIAVPVVVGGYGNPETVPEVLADPEVFVNASDEESEIIEIGFGPKNEEVFDVVVASEAMWEEVLNLPTVQTKEGILRAETAMRKIDPFLGLQAIEHTFFANGIAVGDTVVENGLKN